MYVKRVYVARHGLGIVHAAGITWKQNRAVKRAPEGKMKQEMLEMLMQR